MRPAGYRVIVCDELNAALVGHDGARYTSVAQDRDQALTLARLLLELSELPDEDGPRRTARPGAQRIVSLERAG